MGATGRLQTVLSLLLHVCRESGRGAGHRHPLHGDYNDTLRVIGVRIKEQGTGLTRDGDQQRPKGEQEQPSAAPLHGVGLISPASPQIVFLITAVVVRPRLPSTAQKLLCEVAIRRKNVGWIYETFQTHVYKSDWRRANSIDVLDGTGGAQKATACFHSFRLHQRTILPCKAHNCT